jgi:phthiocerol/phenolphthiocerol synthesis type-I polyketide synthase C
MTDKVAIVGFAFRLPGCSPDGFFQALSEGKDLVTTVDPGRWAQDTFLHPNPTNPGTTYTFAAGSIGDVSGFDADFFGISPREAQQMDPQQRLLLELTWESFENAGIRPSTVRGTNFGVYVGNATPDYSYRRMDDLASFDSFTMTGNTASIAANRISYIFDLRGPSMVIDTACSSFLVAFHQACQAIRSGEVAQALVGTASIHLHPFPFIGFAQASMLSRRGICNVFDASGDGYVRAEGGGVFLLKHLEQAMADRNAILAVVEASGTNCDGKTTGLTVPSSEAQARLLRDTYATAGMQPDELDYLEAHGTGTAVGDPIETKAIGDALGRRRAKPLPIGSVKSNVGHLEAASGAAGLVKALLSIEHGEVPPTIHLRNPNPRINFDEWNICAVTEKLCLPVDRPVTIGINSFGFGGANAHIILRSARKAQTSKPAKAASATAPLLVSARTEAALRAAADGYATYLHAHPEHSVYDVAYSSFFTRDVLDWRLLAFAEERDALIADLKEFVRTGSESRIAVVRKVNEPSGPVFVYSGNGCQWAGMGRILLTQDATFRAAVTDVDAWLMTHGGFSILEALESMPDDRLAFTEVAQPTLFAVQVGLTKLLREQGLQPRAVLGHSVGEVAAAWASGALTLEQAVHVILHRSAGQAKTKGLGGMIAVGANLEAAETTIAQLGLSERLCVAGINSPKGVTLAGETEALEVVEAHFQGLNIFNKRLDLDYAFHSPAMDGIEAGIKMVLANLQPFQTKAPFISTVTGKPLAGQALDANYWWANIRKPVLFSNAIQSCIDEGHNVFLEIGAHPVLRYYISECLKEAGKDGAVISTMTRSAEDREAISLAGYKTVLCADPSSLKSHFPLSGQKLRLPAYPWQREKYWHPVTSERYGFLSRSKIHPLLGYTRSENPWQWENQIDLAQLPIYQDHVVGEATVLPAAAFIDMALAAAQAWRPEAPADLEDMEIHAPLLLDDKRAKTIRFFLDPANGRFQIKSHDRLSEDPWLENVAGRILAGKAPSQRLPAFPFAAVEPNVASETHYVRAKQLGLSYGPAFQAVSVIQVSETTAHAELVIPEAIREGMGGYLLHPAFTDGSFQLLVDLLGANATERTAFIPIRMGRITLYQQGVVPAFASVEITKQSPRSVQADCLLYSSDGTALAEIRNARFRQMVLLRHSADQLHHLRFVALPQPLPQEQQQLSLPNLDFLYERARQLRTKFDQDARHQKYYAEVEPLLDVLSAAYAYRALTAIAGTEAEFNPEDLLARGVVEASRRDLLAHLLEVLEEDQLLLRTESGYAWATGVDMPAAGEIWLTLLQEYPGFSGRIIALNRVGSRLEAILRGASSASELLPALQSPAALALYAEETGRRLERLTLALVEELVAQAPGRIRVLELSQRDVGIAPRLLGALNLDQCDYVLSVPETGSKDAAAGLQERHPSLGVSTWSGDGIEVAEQRPFHLILLPDGLTELPNRQQLLGQLSEALCDGGYLLARDERPSRWLQILLADRETDRLPRSDWRSTFEQCGFERVVVLEDDPDQLSGPVLYMAKNSRRDVAAPEFGNGPWILLGDNLSAQAAGGSSLQGALCAELQARGVATVLLSASSTDSLSQRLLRVTSEGLPLAGIVYLAGIEGEPAETPESRAAQIEQRSFQAIELMKTMEDFELQVPLVLVTRNAQAHLVAAPTNVDDAPLWGLGRSMINEASSIRVRLVDLCQLDNASQAHLANLAAVLSQELCDADEEDEVILTSKGRYGLRLRPVAEKSVHSTDPHEILRLDFSTPGQLKNLRWAGAHLAPPSGDQVEIEVKAAGLNFRDVMYAMGLLSDEAVENGFAGPTLGMELSGIIRSVGVNVTNFRRGDEVLAFAPAAFSTRVVTPAGAVVPKPRDWSFEAAATVPTTYFTAYYALSHLARLQPGEKVLIHGAAGGVGIAAIRLARCMGAEVFGTAGSDEKREVVSLLGATHVLDSRSLRFADEIMEITEGSGVDVILNSLGGEAINRNLRILRPFGRFLELGKRDFYENTQIGLRPFRNNITYYGIDADQLMAEHPALTERLFHDLMDLFANGQLHPLPYRVFHAVDIVEAFRYMQQSRQIGKIVISFEDDLPLGRSSPVPAQSVLSLPAAASYLITGGLSGFGLATAQWLARRGARHLILASRRGPVTEEAKAGVAELEALGVEVKAVSCDVTDRNSLAELLEQASRTLPPIRGVIHAAMVIDDALLRNLTPDKLHRVFAPKILGAIHLDELTRSSPLDFFVVYSSATTIFGNPGQANYVAANQFLESLVCERQQQGLPGLAVCWGAIDDVGFLARNEEIKEALRSRLGGAALRSFVALETLERLLHVSGAPPVGVLDLDWSVLSRSLPAAESPKFREIAVTGEEGEAQGGSSAALQRWLLDLPSEELQTNLVALLKAEVGEILRIAPEKIDGDKSVFDMGLDSLMSVELLTALEHRLGVKVPVMVLSEGPTITKLSGRVISQLKTEHTESPISSRKVAQEVAQAASQHGVELDAPEIERVTNGIATEI